MKKYKILFAGLAAFLFACNNSNKPQAQAPVTKPVEYVKPTAEQAERRRISEAYCKLHDIPVYKNLNALFTDPESKVSIRTKDEIVNRTLALMYLGIKSEGETKDRLDELDKKYHMSSNFTAKEKEYADVAQPTAQQTADANWRYESMHVMLWALGYIENLSYPDTICNVYKDVKIIYSLTEAEFRAKARLRSKKEVLDQADLVLRLHWACVSARLTNKAAPGKLDVDVVSERHYALNWLINYMNQAWDDVTTDT